MKAKYTLEQTKQVAEALGYKAFVRNDVIEVCEYDEHGESCRLFLPLTGVVCMKMLSALIKDSTCKIKEWCETRPELRNRHGLFKGDSLAEVVLDAFIVMINSD